MAKTAPTPKSRIREILAINMKSRRETLGLTQEGLALLCGLHRTYVAHVERLVRNPSLENVERIALALRQEVFELLTPPKRVKIEKRPKQISGVSAARAKTIR